MTGPRGEITCSLPNGKAMHEVQTALHFLATPENHDSLDQFPPDEQAILETVNQKVAGKASLGDVMDFLFDAIQELYPCDRIGLAFIEDDGRRIASHWCKASYEPLLLKNGYAEDLAGSSLRTVLDSGCSRVIYDLAKYEEEHPRSQSTRILVREGVRSSLTCPLMLEGKPFGVIFLSSKEERVYTPYHVRLWRAIAERISQAVEKAYRIDQLTLANQAYNEVLAFVSHELKNPIASMITDARVLAQGYLGEMDPRHVQKLERLIKKGNYLLDLVREYLDLARMEDGRLRLNPHAIDFIDEVLEPAIDIVAPLQAEKGMSLERLFPINPLPTTCDAGLLKIVLVNLLGNAVKYGKEGGLIRLRFDQSEQRISVGVWNEGPGFPAEERPRLFRKFSRLQSPELRAQKGTGVGLYTAWRIVHLHGGRMDASSKHGHWADFSLEFPQPLPQPE